MTGAPCRQNLDSVLPLGLSLEDATAALFGFPPILPACTEWQIAFDREVGAYRLVCGLPDGAVQHLWIREDGTPVRAEVMAKNKAVYLADFGNFETTAKGVLPRRLRFVTPRNDTDFTIRYRSVELGPVISPDDWTFDCPKGLKSLPLPCEETP